MNPIVVVAPFAASIWVVGSEAALTNHDCHGAEHGLRGGTGGVARAVVIDARCPFQGGERAAPSLAQLAVSALSCRIEAGAPSAGDRREPGSAERGYDWHARF